MFVGGFCWDDMTAADQDNRSPVQATRGHNRGTSGMLPAMSLGSRFCSSLLNIAETEFWIDVPLGAAGVLTQGAASQPSATGRYSTYHPSGQPLGHYVGQELPSGAFSMSQMAGTLPNYRNSQPPFNEQHYHLEGPSRSAGISHQPEVGHVHPHAYAVPSPQYGIVYQDSAYFHVHGPHHSNSHAPSPTPSGSVSSYVPGQPHQHSYMHYPPSYNPFGSSAYAPPFSSAPAHGYVPHALGQTASQYGGLHAASLPHPYRTSGQHHPRPSISGKRSNM